MASILPIANYPLSSQASLAAQYVGQRLEDLPTPAVILDRAIIRRNCNAMLQVCSELGVGFRPHVKSHKVCIGLENIEVVWRYADGGADSRTI